MRKAAPASLELVIAALLIAVAVGVPLGLISAARRDRPLDQVIRVGSILGVSMPLFWMALIFQLLFFQKLHLLPVTGEYDPNVAFAHPLHAYTGMAVIDSLVSGNWPMLESSLSHLVMPAIVVAAYPAGVIARMVRASVLDTLGEAHVQMVRALGFSERSVFARFAMKLAWSPVATVIALVFAYSLVNTFLVESIFDWPGLGSYAAASIASLDTPAITGVTLFIAIVYVVANLIVDVIQALTGSKDEASMMETTLLAPSRSTVVRGRMRENPLLIVGGIMAAVIVFVALFAPLLAPYPGDAGSATHPSVSPAPALERATCSAPTRLAGIFCLAFSTEPVSHL